MAEVYSRIKWETIRKRYAKPMMQIMAELYNDLREFSPKLKAEEPWIMDADQYSVIICLKPDNREPIDISLEIIESQDYEGIKGGYTFKLDIVEQAGRILGGLAPYNYTENCWCKTLPAIKERFEILKNAIDANEIAAVIEASNHGIIVDKELKQNDTRTKTNSKERSKAETI